MDNLSLMTESGLSLELSLKFERSSINVKSDVIEKASLRWSNLTAASENLYKLKYKAILLLHLRKLRNFGNLIRL